MRPTRTTALVFAAVTLAATVASSSPAAAFFFPIGLVLGGPRAMTVNPHRGPPESMGRGYTRSRDEDSKPSKASTRTSSKDDDGKSSSKSGKGPKSATKEANAKQRRSVEHEAAASKGSGTSVQRASDTEEASLNNRNIGDFDENLGEARMDDSVQLPPK